MVHRSRKSKAVRGVNDFTCSFIEFEISLVVFITQLERDFRALRQKELSREISTPGKQHEKQKKMNTVPHLTGDIVQQVAEIL